MIASGVGRGTIERLLEQQNAPDREGTYWRWSNSLATEAVWTRRRSIMSRARTGGERVRSSRHTALLDRQHQLAQDASPARNFSCGSAELTLQSRAPDSVHGNRTIHQRRTRSPPRQRQAQLRLWPNATATRLTRLSLSRNG